MEIFVIEWAHQTNQESEINGNVQRIAKNISDNFERKMKLNLEEVIR